MIMPRKFYLRTIGFKDNGSHAIRCPSVVHCCYVDEDEKKIRDVLFPHAATIFISEYKRTNIFGSN